MLGMPLARLETPEQMSLSLPALCVLKGRVQRRYRRYARVRGGTHARTSEPKASSRLSFHLPDGAAQAERDDQMGETLEGERDGGSYGAGRPKASGTRTTRTCSHTCARARGTLVLIVFPALNQ